MLKRSSLAISGICGRQQATGIDGLGVSDDLLELGVDSVMSVGIS